MDAHENGLARRLILGSACVAANIYLLGFALDATLSVIADAIRLTTGMPAVSLLRNLVAELVVVASPAVLLLCLFVPHLPKRVFFPLATFALWGALGFPGVQSLIGVSPHTPGLGLAFSSAQAALAVVAFVTLHAQTGGWFLASRRLPPKSHLVLRTVGAAALSVLLVPAFLVLWMAVGLVHFLEAGTDNFLKVSWPGIETQERVLTKGGQKVHLIGMMHFAEPSFYDDVFGGIPPGALVLAEGVTDRDHRLSGRLSYAGAARALGLSPQPGLEPTAPDEAPAPETPNSSAPQAGSPTVLSADVDVSEFAPGTLKFLDTVVTVYGSTSLRQAVERFLAVDAQFSEPEIRAVFADILDKRNATVLAAFDREASSYDKIYIPWGALHMPGIEKALVARGYAVTATRVIPLVHFW